MIDSYRLMYSYIYVFIRVYALMHSFIELRIDLFMFYTPIYQYSFILGSANATRMLHDATFGTILKQK